MPIRLLSSSHDLASYTSWLSRHADATLWQSLEWKRYQEALGRKTKLYACGEGERIDGSALVVIDRTAKGLCTWDIPYGPLLSERVTGDGCKELLSTIEKDARSNRALVIFRSPLSFPDSTGGWKDSKRHVYPEATRVIDLQQDEQAILAQMKQKGRYNIQVATKAGVRIERSTDIAAYSALANETASRDGFRGHSAKHYAAFLSSLPGSFLLLAFSPDNSQPIAGLLGVIWQKTGIYYYGASSYASRALMAPYLLQWEAMRLCTQAGCTQYDLFGIAPEGVTNHPWAGVSDFKAKFGGTVVSYPPEQQLVLRPFLKAAIDLKRRIIG